VTSRRELSDRDYRTLADFRGALRSFLRFSEEAARTAGLTPAQHQLLLAVRAHEEGAPTMSDMADALQLKLHSTVELAARAEANGLLSRHADPDDHRRVRIELTVEGASKLAELSLAHRDELEQFRAQLGVVEHPDPR